MTKIHRIQETEHRGRRWRRQRLPLILAVLVAVASMAFAGPALAAEPTICEKEAAAGKLPSGTLLCKSIENFEVSGALTVKKLNQNIEVKEGTFNGFAAITAFIVPVIEGEIRGVVAIKPSETTIKLFGLPTKVGLTFEQVGEAEGSITSAPLGSGNCASNPEHLCVHESIPIKANIGFTSITWFGLKLPLSCKTATAVNLPLEENLLLFDELLNGGVGSHFTGTTTFPQISCTEFFTGFYNSALLTSVFSGPGNTFSLYVKEKV